MPLRYQPRPGDIFMCAFPECFDVPEMVKTRPVIVVSPQLPGRRDLVCVVPISHSDPVQMCEHHCVVPVRMLPKFMQATGGDRWAKCDMLYTFSTRRLSGRRDARGKRGYEYPKVDRATLDIVRRAVASSLGIDTSLWSLAKAETRAPKAMA